MSLPIETVQAVVKAAEDLTNLFTGFKLADGFKVDSTVMIPIIVNKSLIANVWVHPGTSLKADIQFIPH